MNTETEDLFETAYEKFCLGELSKDEFEKANELVSLFNRLESENRIQIYFIKQPIKDYT